jgi:hypothetical protein
MTHKPCKPCKPCDKMTRCNMAHNDLRSKDPTCSKGILLEGEGVGPSAKGQQKRMGCEQFFFIV